MCCDKNMKEQIKLHKNLVTIQYPKLSSSNFIIKQKSHKYVINTNDLNCIAYKTSKNNCFNKITTGVRCNCIKNYKQLFTKMTLSVFHRCFLDSCFLQYK